MGELWREVTAGLSAGEIAGRLVIGVPLGLLVLGLVLGGLWLVLGGLARSGDSFTTTAPEAWNADLCRRYGRDPEKLANELVQEAAAIDNQRRGGRERGPAIHVYMPRPGCVDERTRQAAQWIADRKGREGVYIHPYQEGSR